MKQREAAEKQNPGAAATASRVIDCRNRKKHERRDNAVNRPGAQCLPCREFTMNDGRETIGTIVQCGNEFTAAASAGGRLGVFANVKDAMRAISLAHGGAHA